MEDEMIQDSGNGGNSNNRDWQSSMNSQNKDVVMDNFTKRGRTDVQPQSQPNFSNKMNTQPNLNNPSNSPFNNNSTMFPPMNSNLPNSSNNNQNNTSNNTNNSSGSVGGGPGSPTMRSKRTKIELADPNLNNNNTHNNSGYPLETIRTNEFWQSYMNQQNQMQNQSNSSNNNANNTNTNNTSSLFSSPNFNQNQSNSGSGLFSHSHTMQPHTQNPNFGRVNSYELSLSRLNSGELSRLNSNEAMGVGPMSGIGNSGNHLSRLNSNELHLSRLNSNEAQILSRLNSGENTNAMFRLGSNEEMKGTSSHNHPHHSHNHPHSHSHQGGNEEDLGWNSGALSPVELLQILHPPSSNMTDHLLYKSVSQENMIGGGMGGSSGGISGESGSSGSEFPNMDSNHHPHHQNLFSSPVHQQSGQQIGQHPSVNVNNMNQTPQVAVTTHKQIEEIHELVVKISNEMKRLRVDQKQLSVPASSETAERLASTQSHLKSAIVWSEKHLVNLVENFKLEPDEMHSLLQMQQDLYFLSKQLELYITELQSIQSGSAMPSFGLVITSQPFPESVKQNKAIDDPISVHLITGAKFDTKPRAIIKAEVIEPSTSTGGANKKKKSSIGLENAEKGINENGIATFNDLKFPTGTRLNIIRIKFSSNFGVTDTTGKSHTYSIESNSSNPIVVKTNENQWFEAEGLLLDSMIFTNQTEVSWHKFCNWLQRRYLGATRQSLQNPGRPIMNYEFQYIRKVKFENQNTISQDDFNQFWLWFGPILHKIRYQRHINALWTKGFICGFLTREESEMVLKKEQTGTFVIRLSERHDQLVISYQATNPTPVSTPIASTSMSTSSPSPSSSSSNTSTPMLGGSSSGNGDTVKHYLIKADDTHGARKTLPDFLKGYLELTCILQIITNSEQRTLRRCDKESALKEFYSKPTSKSEHGYTDMIDIN